MYCSNLYCAPLWYNFTFTAMKMITRCTQCVSVVFSEQECDLVVMLVWINVRLLTKLYSVHMTVFEIVVHRNVDNWIQLLT